MCAFSISHVLTLQALMTNVKLGTSAQVRGLMYCTLNQMILSIFNKQAMLLVIKGKELVSSQVMKRVYLDNKMSYKMLKIKSEYILFFSILSTNLLKKPKPTMNQGNAICLDRALTHTNQA